MTFRPALVALAGLAIAATSTAQSDFTGRDKFPQFRGFGGLPGNGFGINAYGQPDFRGAMSFSTPIAYSLRDWRVVAGFSVIGTENRFAFTLDGESNDVKDTGNGSGQILLGITLGRFGDLTAATMIPSSRFDEVYNFHYAPPNQKGPIRYAIGVQDLSGNGGSAGTGVEGDEDNSTSLYAVGTWQSEDMRTHLSAGLGTRRFKGVFASGSYQIDPRFKAIAEYDTFGFNVAFAASLYSSQQRDETWNTPERRTEITTQIGLVRGKYPYWSLNFSF